MSASVKKILRQQPVGVAIPSAIHRGPDVLTPGQGIYQESSTQKYPLGSRLQIGERVFYYAHNGSAALSAGFLTEGPTKAGATTTNQTACSVAVASLAGDTRIYITAVTTAQSASAFADGWAVFADVSPTPDNFYTVKIKDNSALATSGTTSYIDIYDALPVALTTSDKLDLSSNIFNNVVIANYSTPTSPALGVPLIPITADYYFWLQTYGPAGVYSNEGPLTAGYDVVRSNATDGSVMSQVAGGSSLALERIGFVINIGTDVFSPLVFLQIMA